MEKVGETRFFYLRHDGLCLTRSEKPRENPRRSLQPDHTTLVKHKGLTDLYNAKVEQDGSEVRDLKSERCLDVMGGKMKEGVPVRFWRCNKTQAQKWSTAEGYLENHGFVIEPDHRIYQKDQPGVAYDVIHKTGMTRLAHNKLNYFDKKVLLRAENRFCRFAPQYAKTLQKT
eukprot:Skav222853  [mRNA]  locus=scaffold850:522800:523508:- [translate_table: standard]